MDASHFPSPLGPSLRPLLRRIGLDERETEVYLALLPMKIGRASSVAKAAKQSRSHTYLVLRSLEEKGLASEIERGGILHFVAESPQRLLSFLQDKEEEIRSVKPLVEGALPFLQSLTTPLVGEPRITKQKGIDAMKQAYRDALSSEYCALFNPETMYRTFSRSIVHILFGQQERLEGRDLLVSGSFAERFIEETEQNHRYEIRLLPSTCRFQTDTIVSGDTLILFAYDEEKTVIRIENKNIADTFRSWFDALWATAKEAKKR